jgi:hypothetical protein
MSSMVDTWSRFRRSATPGPGAARRAVAGTALTIALTTATSAQADRLMIRRIGAHPDYSFELEPHLNLGLVDPPGMATGYGYGAGLRGTIEIVDNGFISSINNTVGIGFGADFVRHAISPSQRNCNETAPDPTDPQERICIDIREGDNATFLVFPVVLQWNFWLSQQWSVFGEPGVTIVQADYGGGHTELHADGGIYAGARWNFAESAALTMRLGYPTFSLGVSFLL